MKRCGAIPYLRHAASSAAALTLLCLAVSATGRAQLAPPILRSFSPTQAAAGSSVTLTFTGANFVPRSPNVLFSPSQGISVTRTEVVSATHISAQLQIDSSAQPGARQVTLMDADHDLQAATSFTITAAATQNCPPGGLACGTQQPAPKPLPPSLRGFSPVQGTQGSTVALTLTGANFAAPASLQLTPSSGITVLSTTVTNSNQIQAQLSIAPTASLGARGVTLTVGAIGSARLTASNTFTVVSGAIAVRAMPMQILRIVPNQITAGSQNVNLTVQGANFVPGTQMTFTVGAGIPAAVFANGPARYINSTELQVSVNVLPSALPGGRDINLQSPSQQTAAGMGMLSVQAAPKPAGPPASVKIAPITVQTFPMSVVALDAPLTVVTQSDESQTFGVPLLDDASVFKWHEQNPGLADYYELRIYAKDGKTLLAVQKITGHAVLAMGGTLNVVPTYFRPTDAFLKQVLDPVRRMVFSNQSAASLMGAGLLKSVPVTPPSTQATMPKFPPDQLNGQLSQGDLQWEVAGFHTYNQNGVAPQPPAAQNKNQSGVSSAAINMVQTAANAPAQPSTIDIEVEISDRWPLKAPQAPNGLACGGTGFGNGLNVQNLSHSGGDINDHPGDQWSLGGTVDLSRSPYQPGYTPQFASNGGQSFGGDVTAVHFDNVFVDWGDGKVVPLTAPPASSSLTSWDPSDQLSWSANTSSPTQHVYQSLGSYTIRVYQLSEGDLQHVSAAAVSASQDGPTTPFMQTALLSKMSAQGSIKNGLSISGVQSSFQQMLVQGSNPGTSAASEVASDAYMLYCHTVDLIPVEDLDANGPLHLKSIDDPDFGAYDLVKAKIAGVVDRPSPSATVGVTAGRPNEVATASTNAKTPIKQADARITTRGGGGPAPIAICSTCDDGMDATTYLNYYGQGTVRVTWTVDGVVSQQTMGLGPSTKRLNLKRQGFDTLIVKGIAFQFPIPEPPIIISASAPIYSPTLQTQPLGNHAVTVQADVLPQPTMPNLSNPLGKALGSLMPHSFAVPTGSAPANNGPGQASTAPNVAEAQSLLNTLAPPPGSNLPPLKIGVLSPDNHSSTGLGAVQYVNGALQQVVSQLTSPQPDQHVASNSTAYQVVASDPTKPCMFLFPVSSGGAFEISGLQNHVTQQGGSYNGTGNLTLHMVNTGSGGYFQFPPIPVTISNWSVPDGLHVQTGSINVSPKLALDQSVPALKGSIESLSGQAGGELDATLNVTLSDDTLRLPGEVPVSWNGVTAEITPTGDWIKDGLSMPTTLIGWSSFTMQSNSVRLDLSHHAGDAAGPMCGPLTGGDWVGVRFASLAITPYTMDLVASGSLQSTVNDWGITGGGVNEGSGLCGALATNKPFTATLGSGTVSFASLNATAFNGTFSATYKSMDIYVPWLDTHLTGDATLLSGGGKEASISFPFNIPPISKTYGNLSFKASSLKFTQEPGIGWAVSSSTHFVFSTENKQFADFDRTFYFGMDGRGYFADAAATADVPLGSSSQLGQTPVDLVSVHLTAPATGTQVLAALFNTNVHLSEVMAAAPVQVNFSIDKSGTNYSTTGPTNAPFTIDVPFPPGQPSSDAQVHPVYTGGSGGGGTEYSGTVDLSELGGPPITGEFRLGYQGGHDYWLTRVSFALSPTGVPLIPVPPVMNLYRVQGGLGHNFPISSFENTGSINAATPVFDSSFLFMAGLRVGMPDQFTYTLDGDLTIKTGGQNAGARLDFHSWLLKSADNGNGDFQGYLQYAGSNFDGRLWGHLNFLGGVASVDMGNSASNAAVDIHFGPSSPWHIDAGKQQGPRIDGRLLFTDANMYVMLSDNGLAIGGGESISLNVGDDSVASAYVNGSVDMGLAITPQPHISGDFSANVDAGVCVDDACVSAGVSAQIHAEALPLDVDASASIGLPWPLGSISFSVHL
jgi:hypothetical protein